MTTATLKHFCSLHATPGDEIEVFQALLQRWQAQGLDTRKVGSYAVIAEPAERKKADTVLLLSHADSPGFIVQSILSPTKLEVLALGGVHPTQDAELILKTSSEKVAAHLHAAGEDWTRTMPLKVTLPTPCPSVQKGDRLCWAPYWSEEEYITSPFLDNRIGCALIADWYADNAHRFSTMNVVLAASAMEEVNGFGANVLAHAVNADLVLALDITYTDNKQHIQMGNGPVITLSDASVLLSPEMRDRLLQASVPLQTEVYNYSGTDARAFPAQGIPTPAIPVLIPTEGNHTQREILHPADLNAWPAALEAVATAVLK
ncbi:MAG: M28 family peptidase [Kiritimatiellae bacterium]|nr:M28 family peptidase [Kiritimatiellia bacterium]